MKKIANLLVTITGPQQYVSVFEVGSLTKKVIILIYGRGGSAADIAELLTYLDSEVHTLIPEAVDGSWYPERFLVPQIQNQPALDSSLQLILSLIMHLEQSGILKEKIILVGFSQGACLVAEYLKQNPSLFGGAVLMSGGLIGSQEEIGVKTNTDSLQNTPIYIGCDTEDTHIPKQRVEETAEILTDAGAKVTLELFTKYGHRPHKTALFFLQQLVS